MMFTTNPSRQSMRIQTNFFVVQEYVESHEGSVLPGTVVREFGTSWPLRARTKEQATYYLRDAHFDRALPGRIVVRLTRPNNVEKPIFYSIDERGLIKEIRLLANSDGKSYTVQSFDEGSQLGAVSAATA
jgi:hypothetical protein